MQETKQIRELKMSRLSILFFVAGILCLLYFTVIIFYAGTNTAFLWFWISAGLASVLLAFIIQEDYTNKLVISKYIKIGFTSILLLGVIIFLLTLANILKQGNHQPDTGADYVVVLGAQVRGTVLSRTLKSRLDTAYVYLEENKNSIVIVSGGQGNGEDISEAEAMSKYLISKGILKNRIIKEDQSTNTNQNILFSKKFMAEGNRKTVIVTSKFHIYRAILIAKKQGLEDVQGLGAPTDVILTLSYYVREFIAVMKDSMVGNI